VVVMVAAAAAAATNDVEYGKKTNHMQTYTLRIISL
jgi:hypothetical protein